MSAQGGDALYSTEKIGQRGVLVTFDELVGTEYDTTTNMYVINTEESVFLCDSFLGPDAAKPVIQQLNPKGRKQVWVINSHYHWDHIWGNCAFPDAQIIAHTDCRRRIIEMGESELASLRRFAMGSVTLSLPTLTFDSKIVFEEEGITVFHSPGHTADSISLYDSTDKVLLAFDNVEVPIPSYMESADLPTYIETLEAYLDLGISLVIPGHGVPLQREDLERNLQYLQDVQMGRMDKYLAGMYRKNHLSNLPMITDKQGGHSFAESYCDN